MSQRYSLEEKVAALKKLQDNAGNIALTSLQVGIPERTLYHWRRTVLLRQILQQQTPASPPQEIPTFDDDLDALQYLRTQIIQELVTIGTALKDTASLSTPQERVAILSQLLDRLMKLDAHLMPYTPNTQVIRFEYEKPEDNPLYRRLQEENALSYEGDDDE